MDMSLRTQYATPVTSCPPADGHALPRAFDLTNGMCSWLMSRAVLSQLHNLVSCKNAAYELNVFNAGTNRRSSDWTTARGTGTGFARAMQRVHCTRVLQTRPLLVKPRSMARWMSLSKRRRTFCIVHHQSTLGAVALLPSHAVWRCYSIAQANYLRSTGTFPFAASGLAAYDLYTSSCLLCQQKLQPVLSMPPSTVGRWWHCICAPVSQHSLPRCRNNLAH